MSKSSGGAKTETDRAISEILQMNPRGVTVTLTLPVADRPSPTVTLEWNREDTTMPLSELLKRIETYVREFGSR
ncbi:MAG TPA: hypothetical protein VGV89_03715 [Thermoplasmata archaeon]|nr:hypothetical protein [Thermoplasmata archaeon]